MNSTHPALNEIFASPLERLRLLAGVLLHVLSSHQVGFIHEAMLKASLAALNHFRPKVLSMLCVFHSKPSLGRPKERTRQTKQSNDRKRPAQRHG